MEPIRDYALFCASQGITGTSPGRSDMTGDQELVRDTAGGGYLELAARTSRLGSWTGRLCRRLPSLVGCPAGWR